MKGTHGGKTVAEGMMDPVAQTKYPVCTETESPEYISVNLGSVLC